MLKDPAPSDRFEELREKAEALLGPPSEMRAELDPAEIGRLLHEFEVHRIELDIQNDELKATQRELEASRKKYKDLYEAAPCGYFTLNPQSRIVEVNLTGSRMLGVDRADLIGTAVASLLSPEDADRLHLHLNEVLETGKSQGLEVTFRVPDSAEIECRLESVRSSAPEEGLCRTAVIEVNQRSREQRQQLLLAKAVKDLAEGVLITGNFIDEPGPNIVYANEAMERMSGFTLAEMMGQSPRMFQGPRTDRQVLDHIRRRLEEGLPVRCELVNHRKNGTAYEQELFIAPIRNTEGQITNFLSIHTDISVRRRLYRDLMDRQARLRAVMDASEEAIITFDDRGIIEDFNPAAENLFGYRAEEVVGRKVAQLMPSIHPAQQTGPVDEAAGSPGGGIETGREINAHRRDGTAMGVRLFVSEFHVGGRNFRTAIVRDAEQERPKGQAPERWKDELERRVAESTRELKHANQELRELNFFISHDLKTPIRAVRNYVDFLMEDLEGELEGPAAEDLKHLKQANEELQAMVEHLLAYSRLGAEKQLGLSDIDIGKLIDSIAGPMTDKTEKRVIAEGDFPVLRVPEVVVRQIFQNLIENGLKYNESETPEVRISATRMDGGSPAWVFAFHDNGIGIEEKHHQEIFGMFHRLNSIGTTMGSGIGLASVKKAVTLLDGSVRVESSPGAGSTFYVEIPEGRDPA